MKIESIIKRDPPTVITLGDTTYRFQPDDQGRHVADVTDKHHIARLLSIAEGYQLADDESLPKAVQTELNQQIDLRTQQQAVIEPVSDAEIKGSTVHPATFDINGEQISIDDVIAEALTASALTTREWNELDPEERHKLIDAILDAMSGDEEDPANPTPPDLTTQLDSSPATPENTGRPEDEREAAAQEYKAKFGKLPHYKWTIEKIREELAKPAEGAE